MAQSLPPHSGVTDNDRNLHGTGYSSSFLTQANKAFEVLRHPDGEMAHILQQQF